MFEQSENIADLALGLLTFHKEVGTIKKDSTNPFFKSKYASLSNILDAIEEPLLKSELVVLQFPNGEGLTTQLVHKSGQFIRATYTMPIKEANNPQALGSSITYARRYALAAVLSLNIDEDDDANAASSHSTLPQNAPQSTTQTSRYPTKLAAGTHLVTIQSVVEKEYNGKPLMELTTDKGVGTIWDANVMHEVTGREGQRATVNVLANQKGNLYIADINFE